MSPIRAAYFNGEDATRWPVSVLVSAGALVIKYEREAGAGPVLLPSGRSQPEAVYWPRGTFRPTQGGHLAEPLRLERDLEALIIDDPVDAERLLAALGFVAHDWSRAAGLIALGAAVLAALSYFLALPH